jgi:acetate kinase
VYAGAAAEEGIVPMTGDDRGPVLVADAGSSSLHLTLYADDGRVLAGRDSSTAPGEESGELLRQILKEGPRPVATGHRIVHGGPELTSHVLVDDRVRTSLRYAADLAPLHVPPALAILDAARDLLPDLPHAACLDTAFHSGLPPAAREFALPAKWRREYGLRRYGFHGLSYTWALARTAEVLDRRPEELQVVIAHLGGGCSACAVRDGRSVDTTMGFTPLDGLVMTHRSGSVDPGALTWLQTRHGLTPQQIDEALNQQSGLLALSGTSDDTRDLVRDRAAGDERAALALDVFSHHARRGIAAMATSLDRLDALVFTGEIGEDQPELREEICARLSVLGVAGGLRPADGVTRGRAELVSGPSAGVPVIVVPTGEARQVERETRALLRRG